jgi:hypothetical protein
MEKHLRYFIAFQDADLALSLFGFAFLSLFGETKPHFQAIHQKEERLITVRAVCGSSSPKQAAENNRRRETVIAEMEDASFTEVLRERFALLKRLHFHLSSPSLGRLR